MTSRPRQRRPLTRRQVVSAGLRVIDGEGVDALTMRRLGAELGVEAMSLYHHVASKEDLLDAVVELLWEEASTSLELRGTWRDDIHAFAGAVHQTAHDHPSAYPLMLNRGVLPAIAVQVAGTLVGSLRAAGFGPRLDDAVRTVVGYVAGYTMAEVAWYADPAPVTAPASPSEAGEDRDAEMRRMLLECDTEAQFSFGLEVLLDGLQRLLDDGG
ncbi:MAG: TetR family transcriptional regulator [Actinomycetota bacterium]|nr:TetR family transcriptional regulator [Actinomycetota bacterium]